ncbi:MAG: PucR family transcriptional regulator ligand-binding domain-containing protein [Actinobacteria bacterium]|nr:PucR family transcriptional regulator ligand-binding domain-containing protein [Actinomycetota bacterium]
MDLSLRKILKLEGFKGSSVLAGKNGLEREIHSVTVGEVPDIANWLTGGELILSTFSAVKKSKKDQIEFAEKIIKSKAVALVVKLKRYINSLPDEIIKLADEQNFPIIEVPSEIRWTDLIQEISRLITDEQFALLERSNQIHHYFLDKVIKGGGWHSLGVTTAGLINRSIVIMDFDFNILDQFFINEGEREIIENYFLNESDLKNKVSEEISKKENNDVKDRIVLPFKDEWSAAIIPIIVDEKILGFISTFELSNSLDELDFVALEHAATVGAIEFIKERVAFETETRIKGDFIDGLLSGQLSKEELLRRAKFLGCDLNQGCFVAAIGIDDFKKHAKGLTELELQEFKEEFFRFVSKIITRDHLNSLSILKNDVFLPPLTEIESKKYLEKIKILASEIQRNCSSRFFKHPVSIGISRFCDKLEKLKDAYKEALTALDVSRKFGKKTMTLFDEIGIHKILLRASETDFEELRSFYEETIGLLENYERNHQTDLIKTLVVFFECNENINLTANKLFTHRHTIRYRLQRISEITGLDLAKSEDKEKLSFGLKIKDLISRE